MTRTRTQMSCQDGIQPKGAIKAVKRPEDRYFLGLGQRVCARGVGLGLTVVGLGVWVV